MEIGCLMGALSLLSLEDLKMKRIPIVPLLLTGIIGMIFHLIYGNREITDILGGLSIGFVLYAISQMTEGKIGKGDGFLYMVTGVYFGFWNNLILLWLSSVLAGIVGIAIILIKKKNRDYKLPFVPFTFVAALLMLLAEGGTIS